MTGSDSGSSGGNYGGNSGGAISCDSLAFETVLSSPKPNVVSMLSVGDILDIQIHVSVGVETVVILHNNDIAGGLVKNSDVIKTCLDKGYQYEAEVREIKGAQVKIFVSPA